MKRHVFAALCCASNVLACFALAPGVQVSAKPTIVSPSRPTDSRHEVVYAQQGKDEQDVPVVDGLIVQPVVLKQSSPKFPKSLRGKTSALDVTVEGVIAPAGDFIDPVLKDAVALDVQKSVLDALSKYRFRAATLNGKPVAVLGVIVIRFESCATRAECNTFGSPPSTEGTDAARRPQ